MDWRINRRKPNSVPRWRWVLGNYWRKALWLCGLHWKQRPSRLTADLFLRRIRWGMLNAHVPWDKILRNDPCCYCGKALSFDRMTVEHVVPKSHGGADLSHNKVGCCAACNRARGALPLLAFLIMRPRRDFFVWARREAAKHPRNSREWRRASVAGLVTVPPRLSQPLRASIRDHVRWRTIVEMDAKNRKPTDVDLRA